ncbi:phosphatase PAP2 family protein [Natrarchaeobius oligotrophus]|uniref:Phosphatase PAP2 family protein n=1 Tax=Natrarchaeobius chitinivorans TaxID=1679083 RepID=A0A3N6PJK5_NATCH|nr:phosphatase PAP2 family protein [Natrarchaeobius chitinivorans]RQH01280.1 phosphatase PAP2 family protein [Natrarchaeobius chitinivorans]
MRLEDESVVVREAYPAEYAELVLAVTELGGTTVPMVLLAVLFWLSSRRRTALVISYAVAGVAFLLAIKAALALPRPPESALLVPLSVDGYGFPSGHAFAAVVVYGGLCFAFERTQDRRWLAAIGAIVVLVSLSRVILGVHYLGDVLAGAVLGVAFLLAANRLIRGDPEIGFAVAVALAAPAVVVTGGVDDALLALGGGLGGLAATLSVDGFPETPSRTEGALLVAVGLAGLAAIRTAADAVTVAPIQVGAYAVLVAWVLFVPVGAARLSPAMRRPFDSS